MHETWLEYIVIWFLSLLGAASVTGARVGYWLYGREAPEPPCGDEPAFRHWKRRRAWIVLSEISALPAFASMALAVPVWLRFEIMLAPPIAIVMSLTGFLLLVDGVQRRFRIYIGLKEENGGKHDF